MRGICLPQSAHWLPANLREIPLVVVALATGLVGMAATAGAQETTRFNILTVDHPMIGFGDLVSNWVVARYLRETQPGAVINFYVSPEFHARFRAIVPGFEPDEAIQELNHDNHGVIRVYSRTNPPWGADDDVRQAMNTQRETLTAGAAPTCNLAFTVNQHDLITRGGPSHMAFSPAEGGAARHALLGASALSRQLLDDTKLRFGKGAVTPVRGPVATPFLEFNVLRDSGTGRIRQASVGHMWDAEGNFLWPIIEFRSGFANRSLFLVGHEVPSSELRAAPHYNGFGHAASQQVVAEYVGNIVTLANTQPNLRFGLVVTSVQETPLGTGPAQGDWQANFQGPPNVVGQIQAVMALQQNQDEDGPTVFRETRLGQHRNVALFEFQRNLPYTVTNALVAGSNLPVLVTGTMGLSQALQHGKPFLYEVRNWHDTIAIDLGSYLAGDRARFYSVLISRDESTNAEVRQYLGSPDVDDAALVTTRGDARDFRDRFLFGIQRDGNVVQADWAVSRNRYLARRAAIIRYRDEHPLAVAGGLLLDSGTDPVTLPSGHVLDNVVQFCNGARTLFEQFREEYAQSAPCASCLTTIQSRRERAATILRRLVAEFEAQLQH